MSCTEFSFVIVGSGNIARTYWDAIGNLEGVRVSGLVSRSLNRPDFLPESIPVFSCLNDAPVEFDAVALCTPNGTHAAAAITAASIGKHVLVEKVLEISSTAMDEMIAACRNAQVTLAVTFQRRMSPDNQAVKALIDSGKLGKIFAADMRVKFWRDDSYYASGDYRGGYAIDGGGPFIQQAAHNVDVFVWFFSMPTKVVSMLGTYAHAIEVEDHGVALLHYEESGMIGSITASSACKPGFSPVLEIHSNLGSIVMKNDEITRWEIDGIANPAANPEFEIHDGADSATVADTAGHEAIIADFVDAIRNDRSPAVPGESGRLATDLVLEIYGKNVLADTPSHRLHQ